MSSTSASKTAAGRFFEDFRIGETIRHATPRTVRTGPRRSTTRSTGPFRPAERGHLRPAIGYPARSPIDDLLVFHVVFGKTVPDISLNAVGQSRLRRVPLPEARLSRRHPVGGLRGDRPQGELNRQSGVVYVRSRGGTSAARRCSTMFAGSWCASATITSRASGERADLPEAGRLRRSAADARSSTGGVRHDPSGSPQLFEDYAAGERIDHVDGVTVEEAEHMIATRLYQNTAKVHFNQHSEGQGRFGRRLIYGGHVISLARALSFNGLANAFHIAAINGGRHVAPLFAGDTVFAWSEILETAALPHREDVGALRVRTIATKNRPCADFPLQEGEGYEAGVILDLDYWALAPRRP